MLSGEAAACVQQPVQQVVLGAGQAYAVAIQMVAPGDAGASARLQARVERAGTGITMDASGVIAGLPGELTTANNATVERVVVHVVVACDANGDGRVNILDLIKVRNALGRDAQLHSYADLDRNGTIDVLDLIMARNAMRGR